MLFTSSIVLALAAAVSAQNGTFTNGTTTTSAPVTVVTPGAASVLIQGWNYVGCAAPPSLAGLTTAFQGPQLTAELCAQSCDAYAYFGLSGDNCFCANQVQNGTAIVADDQCSTPCPGNSLESCGRAAGASPSTGLARRQAVAGGALLSLYQQAIIPEGLVYIDINIVVYIDIDVNIGVTYTNTFCQTVTRTGCGCPTTQSIPMVTVTSTCTAAGQPTSTVTVTVPAAVVTPAVCPGNCAVITGTAAATTPVYPTTVVCPGGVNCPAVSTVVCPGGASCPIGTAVVVPSKTPVVATTTPVFTGGAVAKGFSGVLALAAGAVALL